MAFIDNYLAVKQALDLNEEEGLALTGLVLKISADIASAIEQLGLQLENTGALDAMWKHLGPDYGMLNLGRAIQDKRQEEIYASFVQKLQGYMGTF